MMYIISADDIDWARILLRSTVIPDTLLPTLYIPHGGGPCFFMEWTMGPADTWKRLANWLAELGNSMTPGPKAVVVISGHWEEEEFTVTSHPRPPLFYDYYGFPEHTYQLTYDAPGSPDVAQRVEGLLRDAGLPARLDPERGFDHGVFIPFKLIYPGADIPIVQLSLKTGLDATTHLAAGAALETLRKEGILIVGSGMSYHNLREFGSGFNPVSDKFDRWLTEAVRAPNATSRSEALRQWDLAPDARRAHPRAEHLLPLMVAAGAGGADLGTKVFTDRMMGTVVSGFQFGSSESQLPKGPYGKEISYANTH
jgi:aromatic ring-opening dioxygenase catalytic subunit (LigB family)